MVFLEWRDSICLLISASCMLTHTVKATCAPAILHIQCESTDSGGGVVLDRAAPPPQTPQPRHIPLHPQFDCVARETSGRYAGLVFLHNDVQIKHRSVIKKRSRGGKLAFYSHSRHFIQQVLKAKSSYFFTVSDTFSPLMFFFLSPEFGGLV